MTPATGFRSGGIDPARSRSTMNLIHLGSQRPIGVWIGVLAGVSDAGVWDAMACRCPVTPGVATSAVFSLNGCRHMGHFPWLESDCSQSPIQCMWKQWVQLPITIRGIRVSRRHYCGCLKVARGERGTSHTDGTVVAGIFAFGAGPFKLDTTDTAGVVGILGQIPLPFRHRLVSGKGDLHYCS